MYANSAAPRCCRKLLTDGEPASKHPLRGKKPEGPLMPRYLTLTKYTPDALAAVRKEGYTSRVQNLRTLMESVGGSLESLYFMPSAQWDFVAINNCDSDAAFAILSLGSSSKVVERVEMYELKTGEEADSAVARQMQYRPPGDS